MSQQQQGPSSVLFTITIWMDHFYLQTKANPEPRQGHVV